MMHQAVDTKPYSMMPFWRHPACIQAGSFFPLDFETSAANLAAWLCRGNDVDYSDKVRLANLYLYHVLAFCEERKVKNSKGQQEESNEQVMRTFEEGAGIKEEECAKFREQVKSQFGVNRMDLLYGKIGFVFEYFLETEENKMREWIVRYPYTPFNDR